MASGYDLKMADSRDADEVAHHEHALAAKESEANSDDYGLEQLGYKAELQRTRSLFTLLFQSLAIAAIPFGEGSALNSAIIGGGQLPLFVGWIVVCFLDECIAMSLSELASRFPTSAGPYYWSFQLSKDRRTGEIVSFITGWAFVVGNWTITLSVNFGTASLLAGTVTMYHPTWTAASWELLLIFYAMCIGVATVCILGNRVLPHVDTAASIWNAITIVVCCIALSVAAKVGRHSVHEGLAGYDQSISGWEGFSFFIGLLPAAYTFSAIGLISSMAEECRDARTDLPKAIALCVPIGGIAGLFYILPICFTLPSLKSIIQAPEAEGLPYVFHTVMGSPGGGLALMFFVLVVCVFCSISITTAASRCTWAFARDGAIPLASVWAKVSSKQVPVNSIILVTVVQMLLGLINLGSSSAFTAFVSTGVIALAASYAIPISMSVADGRKAVSTAQLSWHPIVGWTVNSLAVIWVAFQLVLFSMPTELPVTLTSMNWACVVFVGFMALAGIYYVVYARRIYEGPPKSDGI